MGLDIFALVTEWKPAVAAYREAGGLDFYWDANVARNERYYEGNQSDELPELPYLEEWDLPGGRRSFMAAAEYYDFVRPHLPEPIRAPADTAFGMVLPGYGFEDWLPEDRNELMIDASAPGDGALLYAMRPATARKVSEIEIDWASLQKIADEHPYPEDGPQHISDHRNLHADTLEWVAQAHLAAVASAAARGRGIIAIISQ